MLLKRPGEVLDNDVRRFGMELRQYTFGGNYKSVLCPFWEQTEYGIVRCRHTGIISLDDTAGCLERVIAHYGSYDAFRVLRKSATLYDEEKCCDIHTDDLLTHLEFGFPIPEDLPGLFYEELAKHLLNDRPEFAPTRRLVHSFLATRLELPNPSYEDVLKWLSTSG